MAIELANKIRVTIESYKTSEEEYLESLRQALEKYKSAALRQRFTQDGLKAAIQEDMKLVLDEWYKADQVLNQLLKIRIQKGKDQLITPTAKKSMDYSIQISNALRFVELEGESITDEILYSILKEFVDDLHQMQLFERVVKKQLKGSRPDEVSSQEIERYFSKTFGKLHQFQFIMNTFNEIEALGENLFIHDKVMSEELIIGLHRYLLPISGYTQRAHETLIVKLAEVIDRAADPFLDSRVSEASTGVVYN